MDKYYKYSTYLPDINNERPQKNATYRNNLLKLNHIHLIYSSTENIVIPAQSPWFYFYANGSDTTVVPIQQSDQWNGDWLGLKTLFTQGKLSFGSVPCDHQDIPRDVCKDYWPLYRPFINNTF